MSKHRDRLLRIAQNEFPTLLYDVQQGTATIPLQQAVLKLTKIVQVLLYDHLHDQEGERQAIQSLTSPSSPAAAPALPKTPAPATAPPPAPVLTPQHSPAAGSELPPLDTDPQSVASANVVQIPGLPPVEIDPNVTNVVVTPQGSHVIAGPSAPKTETIKDSSGLPPL
jgi:hypothetical protein